MRERSQIAAGSSRVDASTSAVALVGPVAAPPNHEAANDPPASLAPKVAACTIEVGQNPAGPTLLDLERLLATRLLIQAGSGGGKSWLLRRLIEQAFGKVRLIVFDPEGELVTLAETFDFTVCAPDSKIAPIGPSTGAAAARAIYLSGRSAILCLSEFDGLQEMQQFVGDFCGELLRMPQEHWHHMVVAIDEAQIFAPQNDKAESKKPLIDLSRRGRKRGICPIFATQRLSELSKGVAGQLENRMIGLTTLDLDVARAADMLGMRAAQAKHLLSRLPGGHFIAFGPALGYDLSETKVGPVITRHGLLQAFTGVAAAATLTHEQLAEQLRQMHRDDPEADGDVQEHHCPACRRSPVVENGEDEADRLDAEGRLKRAYEVADQILAGVEIEVLAEVHGVTGQSVRNWLHQALAGIDLRRLGIHGDRVRVERLREHAPAVRLAMQTRMGRALREARRASRL